jgi:uncharacterized protein YjbI with pentapeptide repeats
MSELVGGVLTLGTYSALGRVRLIEMQLTTTQKDEPRVLVSNCDLEKCDLRQMSWAHFQGCRFIDCRLPEIGHPADARGCFCEITGSGRSWATDEGKVPR